MKELMAIIRMNMINQTKLALASEGIVSLHARECLGRGKGLVDFIVLKGAEQKYEEAMSELGSTQRLIPKRMLSMILPDKLVKKAVEVIISVNKTGKSGDGKIFVMPVTDSIRIRTGETGNDTLDEV
jgi:nitrogen regulatory protein PII 2